MSTGEQLFKEALFPHLMHKTQGDSGIRLSLLIDGIADPDELRRAIDYGCRRYLCNPAQFQGGWIVDLTQAGIEITRP